MPGYRLEGPKAARMYEVILPKKLGYFGKVQQVLEDLFDEQAIRSVPAVRQTIARRLRDEPGFDADDWVRTLYRASQGYSIYEMDGRFLFGNVPIDERVLVIRFIFHDREDRDARTHFLDASQEVVNYLVAHRFAEELGVEQEIWFLEYPETRLSIWRKYPPEGDYCL